MADQSTSNGGAVVGNGGGGDDSLGLPEWARPMVVVGLLDRTVGLIVEEVHSQQDIVIKSMGRLRDVSGVAGAN